MQNPTAVPFLGEPLQCVESARYLGVTLDTQLTWSVHVNQVGKKAAERLGVLGSLLNRRSGLPVRNGVLLYKQLMRPIMDMSDLEARCPQTRPESASVTFHVFSHFD
jgi:hypothetical protein